MEKDDYVIGLLLVCVWQTVLNLRLI